MAGRLFLLTCLVGLSVGLPVTQHIEKGLDQLWQLYKERYGKTYSPEEDEIRKGIFRESAIEISIHNMQADLGIHAWRKGFNQFSDMRDDEWLGMTGLSPSNETTGFSDTVKMYTRKFNDEELPESVDWRGKLLPPAKKQGKCGSCYAFATLGSIEGQLAKKRGKIIALSEQQIVDCGPKVSPRSLNGCHGGSNPAAFDYIKKVGGIEPSSIYPYTAKEGECMWKPKKKAISIKGYIRVTSDDNIDTQAIKEAVAKVGPLSIGIAIDKKSMHAYKGGIYDNPECPQGRNHAVVIVGYGSENGKDYWIVRNSWGEGWGEGGHIRIVRGKNMCNMESDVTFPDM